MCSKGSLNALQPLMTIQSTAPVKNYSEVKPPAMRTGHQVLSSNCAALQTHSRWGTARRLPVWSPVVLQALVWSPVVSQPITFHSDTSYTEP